MLRYRFAAALCASLAAACVSSPSGVDARVPRGSGLASKKATPLASASTTVTAAEVPAPQPPEPRSAPLLLATLVQTHTDERVPLDDRSPSQERFSALLADRVTGERHAFDPKLLDLLRALARRHPAARIELVSGYRSAKLNEMMRKKGHHVASHSQHSLGHAVDFRIVPGGETKGLDPRVMEKEIRDLGWEGGVGVYTLSSDWFVHADVGKNRRWNG
jgi:uncharacterized protein YcbK (DUF882 family)